MSILGPPLQSQDLLTYLNGVHKQGAIMIEFQVDDMTCGHCVGAITQAIVAVDASAKVEIDLPTHRVRIHSSDQPQKLGEAIREAGYTPVLID